MVVAISWSICVQTQTKVMIGGKGGRRGKLTLRNLFTFCLCERGFIFSFKLVKLNEGIISLQFYIGIIIGTHISIGYPLELRNSYPLTS